MMKSLRSLPEVVTLTRLLLEMVTAEPMAAAASAAAKAARPARDEGGSFGMGMSYVLPNTASRESERTTHARGRTPGRCPRSARRR